MNGPSIINQIKHVTGDGDNINDPNETSDMPKETSESDDNNSECENESNSGNDATTSEKGRPKRGRKRKFAEQDRNIRKRKRNSNEEYFSAQGNFINRKPFIDFHCKCKNKCYQTVSSEVRKRIFETFWDLGNYDTQTTFIASLINENKVKRKYAPESEKRIFSRTYLFQAKRVCRDIFVNTLRISTKRVNTALQKVRTLSIPDKRGGYGGYNKLDEERKNSVIEHIAKFPRYISHYSRENTGKQEFLPQDTTLPLMYKLYKTDIQDTPVSFSTYKKIFYSEFNLKTKPLQKDTCNKCDTFKIKAQNADTEEERLKWKTEHDAHLLQAEVARSSMKNDFSAAASNPEIETLSFDLEKTLPLPRIPTNIIFYKRQLWLYNFGIHAGSNNRTICNVWLEGEAGRGAQEVGSCLRTYCANNMRGIRSLILWSDSCGGQNRNIKVVLLLKTLLEEHESLEEIRCRYLMSGHSFLPNDTDFGDIECAIKRQQRIYSPDDYMAIMKNCRRKNAMIVERCNAADFVSTANLEKLIQNRKVDTENNKINWLQFKEIKLLKSKPFSILIKTDHNVEEYREIDLSKKKIGRPSSKPIFSEALKPLWPDGKLISSAKLQDIKSYMYLIPKPEQHFYRNLKGDSGIIDDIDGFNGVPDFEIEDQS